MKLRDMAVVIYCYLPYMERSWSIFRLNFFFEGIFIPINQVAYAMFIMTANC